jgi:hypothetical protein
MKITKKKGLTLADAFPAVLTIAVIAILFVALIYMFTVMQSVPANIARSTTNETISPTTDGVNIGAVSACGSASYSILTVINSSTGPTIASGNYTLTSAGVLKNLTSTFRTERDAWNITYTYTDKGSTCSAASSFTTQFAAQVPLVGLILTIVLIAIVIGVLVTSFFLKRKSSRV